MPGLVRVSPADVDDATAFLRAADLTLAGIGDEEVCLWVERDRAGRVVTSTGFEREGEHALIRSVAVSDARRRSGRGTELARFAMARAIEAGATHAWLFSRRSGPFWQKLGFEQTSTSELEAALGETSQVRLFARTGQLERETAWTMRLSAPAPTGT